MVSFLYRGNVNWKHLIPPDNFSVELKNIAPNNRTTANSGRDSEEKMNFSLLQIETINKTTTITPPKNTKNKQYITQLTTILPKNKDLTPENNNNNPAKKTGLLAFNVIKLSENFATINNTALIIYSNNRLLLTK